MRTMEAWDSSSSFYIDDHSSSTFLHDPADLPFLRPPAPPPSSFPYCKQEPPEQPDYLNFLTSTNYHLLPQLESPSLPPPPKRFHLSSPTPTEKFTDWRTLDKFVASQLSPGDPYPADTAGYAVPSDGDILELFLDRQGFGGVDEENKSTCDVGMCILGK